MANTKQAGKAARRRLARIRCVQESIDCFKLNKKQPIALCYVPEQLECKINKFWAMIIHEGPSKKSEKVSEVALTPNSKLLISGEEFCNSEGQWSKLLKPVYPKV